MLLVRLLIHGSGSVPKCQGSGILELNRKQDNLLQADTLVAQLLTPSPHPIKKLLNLLYFVLSLVTADDQKLSELHLFLSVHGYLL
jgi:hypothetical protein